MSPVKISARNFAAFSLGLLGDREAVPRLRELARDTAASPDLRGYALLGAAMTGDPDVANLLHLAGFEVVHAEGFMLLPKNIPLVSAVVNGLLAKMPLFRPLNDREILRVLQVTNVIKYSDGETVIKEGEKGDELFIVLTGKVQVEAMVGYHREQTKLDPKNDAAQVLHVPSRSLTATVWTTRRVDVRNVAASAGRADGAGYRRLCAVVAAVA